MTQQADAIVTGFVKSPELMMRSLAPLRRLQQERVLRRIVYVTWDAPEIDQYVAPLLEVPEIQLVRVPQPLVSGTPNQRGVVYQIRNLEAALSEIAGDNTLVLKLRPDFVVSADFLSEKIREFDRLCEVPASSALGVCMPKPVLRNKIWVPWADSNQPFFYEDAAFLGRKRDLRKLVTTLSHKDIELLGDASCSLFPHVVRYSGIFLRNYPIFEGYLRNYRYFVNDLDYRLKLVPELANDGFFWHVIIAHAWILHSQFHVDAGAHRDIAFYSNNCNLNADWSKPDTLRVATPYDDVVLWRNGTKPGFATRSPQRAYGRLVDDEWQRALFTSEVADFPRATLKRILENVSRCGDGRLRAIESEFYRKFAALHAQLWTARKSEAVAAR